MSVSGASQRLFNGELRGKRDRACRFPVADAYALQAAFAFDECGTLDKVWAASNLERDWEMGSASFLKGANRFENTVFYKDGSSEFITVRDKMLTLICHILTDTTGPGYPTFTSTTSNTCWSR